MGSSKKQWNKNRGANDNQSIMQFQRDANATLALIFKAQKQPKNAERRHKIMRA
jgi:hypothetical protein